MEKNSTKNSCVGISFEEMSTEEMENIFGGTAENVEARSLSIVVSKVTLSIVSAGVSAISGIISYNKECLG